MEKSEVQKLRLGLYKIHWKDGGFSLASVGMTYDGTRWMAPSNWTTGSTEEPFKATTDWKSVLIAEFINIPDYDEDEDEDDSDELVAEDNSSLHATILQRLKDVDLFFEQEGCLSDVQYIELVAPLHQALLELSKQ